MSNVEVNRVPPAAVEPSTTRAETASNAEISGPLPAEPPTLGRAADSIVAETTDLLNIHPLDVTAALLILVAEVRGALAAELTSVAPTPAPIPTPLQAEYSTLAHIAAQPSAASAPLTLVSLVLQQVERYDTHSPEAWLVEVTRIEANAALGLDRAVSAVTAWRNVPAQVVDIATDTRALVLAAIRDDPPNPLWLRPEWLGLAPRMERFRRRRRHAWRRLSDPDAAAGSARRDPAAADDDDLQ